MKILLNVLLAGVVCASFASAAEPDFDAVVKERLGAAQTPSCIAAALVGEKTQEALACTETIAAIPFDRDSAFEIGSITKGFTGLLLADMVLRGEVSLDDLASKYSRPGAKLPTYGGRDITLRDLVTQTSGLPRLPPGFAPRDMRNPYADFDADALYAALARTEIKHPMGTPEYSNFGFMWLSEMLARRGGKHFDVLVKERILDPLGMTDSFFIPTEAQRARLVQPHAVPFEPTPVWDFSVDLAGVGGLRSTLADMEKLASALAGRRDTPLKEAIALALDPIRPSEGPGNFTGFGWVTTSRDGMLIQWHNGGTGGSRAMIAVNPRTRTAAIVLVNSAVSFDDLPRHLVEPRFPLTKKHVRVEIEPEARVQYVGRYEFGARGVLDVFVDGGRMMARMSGQPAIEIAPEGSDRFFTIGVDASLEFKRNAASAVDAVVLRQSGIEIRAQRLP